MKKIISAAALAAMVAGSAFADVSWSANARVYDDVVTYETATRASKFTDRNAFGTDDNGNVTWNKDTKHADDVTLKASGEKCGAQITFNATGPADGAENNVTIGTYKLWAELLPGLTLNAGAYDTRLGKTINNDGNWGTNLSGIVKPGTFKLEFTANNAAGNKTTGKDSTNLTAIGSNKKYNNFMAQYKVNDNLTAYAVMWLKSNGFGQTALTTDDRVARFSPWGVGAKYSVNKDTTIAAVVKQEANVEANISAGTVTIYDYLTGGDHLAQALARYHKSYVYGTAVPTITGGYQMWSAAVDVSTKVAGWDAEAAYTFAALVYDNFDKLYGHSHNYWYKRSGMGKNSISSANEYIHAFDVRGKGKVGDKLTITAIGNLTYKPATANKVHTTAEYGEVKLDGSVISNTTGTYTLNQDAYLGKVLGFKAYKNEEAYNAGVGLSGALAHYESLSVDYALNSQITLEVQANHQNTNVYVTSQADKRVKVGNEYVKRSVCVRKAV